MRGRHIPYLVGGFMLLPFGIWLVAWAFFFPGPKHGFDGPMAVAMLAVSLPLVVWFFLANLGHMANSIAGADAFEQPTTGWVRWVVARLPATALLIGLASIPALIAVGKPSYLIPLPGAVALLVAWAIIRGEAARKVDAAGRRPEQAVDAPTVSGLLADVGRTAVRAICLVPVVGWMVREAIEGSDRDRWFFALNLALVVGLAIAFFGLQAVFFIALALVPVAFVLILILAAA